MLPSCAETGREGGFQWDNKGPQRELGNMDRGTGVRCQASKGWSAAGGPRCCSCAAAMLGLAGALPAAASLGAARSDACCIMRRCMMGCMMPIHQQASPTAAGSAIFHGTSHGRCDPGALTLRHQGHTRSQSVQLYRLRRVPLPCLGASSASTAFSFTHTRSTKKIESSDFGGLS
eukprot:COSAG01_NODE_162_length_23597_cov_21.924130_24_plen_175_part_00